MEIKKTRSASCYVCGRDIQPDWNHCPNCGSPLCAVPSRRTFQLYRETPEKVEQQLTFFQQNNYHHFDFGELFRPTPAKKVSLPGWLWIACVTSILLVPFMRSFIALGVESQVLLYAVYRCSTDRRKLWSILLLVFVWGACLFIWPPSGI